MKIILFLIILSFIACSPNDSKEVIEEIRIKRREQLIKCVNENGSKTLQKLFGDSKEARLRRIIKSNIVPLSKEDKEVFQKCRKESLDSEVLKNILFKKK